MRHSRTIFRHIILRYREQRWTFQVALLITGAAVLAGLIHVVTSHSDVAFPELASFEQLCSDCRPLDAVGDSEKMVVLVFSPTDCGVCLDMLTAISDLVAAGHNQLPVFGIVVTPYRRAAMKVDEEYGFEFPLLWDSKLRLQDRFRQEQVGKPVILYLEGQRVKSHAIIGAPGQQDTVRRILGRVRGRRDT